LPAPVKAVFRICEILLISAIVSKVHKELTEINRKVTMHKWEIENSTSRYGKFRHGD